MNASSLSNLELVRLYFDAIERRSTNEELTSYFHPEVIQEEFPNRFMPRGATRDLKALVEASARGRKVVEAERYEILNSVSAGPQIAVEVQWSAKLKIPVGTLRAGDTMRARFGVFIVFEAGRIKRQANYDCFEEF